MRVKKTQKNSEVSNAAARSDSSHPGIATFVINRTRKIDTYGVNCGWKGVNCKPGLAGLKDRRNCRLKLKLGPGTLGKAKALHYELLR